MKRKRFSEEQIVRILKEAETGPGALASKVRILAFPRLDIHTQ
jgi:hypothetical protein